MDIGFRRSFNASFSAALYDSYRSELSRRLGAAFQFRLAETPVFLPEDLRLRLIHAAHAILDQLCDPARLRRMKKAIPRQWDTPGMTPLPSFTQIDFAVVREENGTLAPRLIELQGFPSLTAMQVIQRDVWSETLQGCKGLDCAWSCWFSGMGRGQFLELARRTIVGSHDPENVILMDLDPPTQKTYPDFAATKLLFKVDAVCPTALLKKDRQLWRQLSDGRVVPVHRIYNRVVFDELVRKRITLPFDYGDELDVEWAPHPNWYWTWSKYSIPFLDHPAVPRATLLSDLEAVPENLSNNYVLKPLFSFAGGGVKVNPKPEDLEEIPDTEKHAWCLQQKIAYDPALRAPDGAGVKVEIRMMFLKPDDEALPILSQNLCRLSRGVMLGVDFNRDYNWVGSSIGLWPA